MKLNEKILDISLIIGALIAMIFAIAADFTADCEEKQDKAFRLHIIANSDSAYDQKVKYDLRDYILSDLSFIFNSCETKAQTVKAAEKSLPLINERVNCYLDDRDYGFTASCSVEKCSFGTRKYGGYTLPAGEYDALKIVIGEGKGQNWWCVLFPTMCLSAVSEKKDGGFPERELYEAEKTSAALTAESLENDIEYKFRLYEIFRTIFGLDE